MNASPPHIARLADLHALAPGSMATVFAAIRSVRHGLDRNAAGYFDLVLSDASAKLPAKIWGDSKAYLEATRAPLAAGQVAKVMFSVGSYREALQLTVTRVRVLGEDDEWVPEAIWGAGFELVEGLRCKTLVFDIETVPGVDARELPDSVGKALVRAADRNEGDEAKTMSLSPYFGKVVSLAFCDGGVGGGGGEGGGVEGGGVEDGDVTVLVVPPPGRERDEFPSWMRPMSETELLRSFWHLADAAELVVTFNGRHFDVPFLVTRSLILGVPARVDLLSSPFSLRPHLDLYRLLGHGGSTSLDVTCWALGIASPKEAMDGSMVAPAYARRDIEAIATYNAADARATAAVYRHLRQHLLPFRNDW
jgi:predicted PolB exonuclease-like 3'-5' exonuclease